MLNDVIMQASENLAKNKTAQMQANQNEDFERKAEKIILCLSKTKEIIEAAQKANALQLAPECGLTPEKIMLLVSLLKEAQAQRTYAYLAEDLVAKLENFSKDFINNANASWRKGVSSSITALYSMLETLCAFTENPAQTRELAQKLKANVSLLPKTAYLVCLCQDQIQKGEHIIENVGANSKVQLFIRKVLQGEATFSDLDDDILHWITVHNLTSRMKISLAN